MKGPRMALPAKETLDEIRKSGSTLENLAKIDAGGLLLAPGESPEEFLSRLSEMSQIMAELEQSIAKEGGYSIFPGITLTNNARIPQEILAEAEEETDRLYGFKVDWVPGFFLSKGVGPLWGGCAISFPGGVPTVFLIRSSFADRRRWFIYDREELMAHELCHVARTPLSDRPLEEHFAYQTAKSRLRRITGNCFQTQFDALAFIVPVFILLAAQILKTFSSIEFPIWPFWLLAFSGPVFLFGRNLLQRAVIGKAEKVLKDAGCAKPGALLFRMSYAETKELASSKNPATTLEKLRSKDSRLAVAFHRFMNVEEKRT